MIDVAVIGAGLAGLVCAQQLQQAGYRVAVVEKSRGVGGRLATRRLQGTCADHGVRYLETQGALTQNLVQTLLSMGVLQPWTSQIYCFKAGELHPFEQGSYYSAVNGLTAVAKVLATGLEIKQGERVVALSLTDQQWQLKLESAPSIQARAIVVAIPAPQALTLLEPLLTQGLAAELVQAVRSVEFDPCITAIAAYPEARQQELLELPWQAVRFADGSDLAWVSLESSKRTSPQPLFVIQSSASFARQYLDTADLKPVGQGLLDQAAVLLPWLSAPTELQVHRWRYAFAAQPLPKLYLAANSPLPLVCSGDWCGGQQTENALESGLAAACQISQLLENHLLPIDQQTAWKTRCLTMIRQLTASLA